MNASEPPSQAPATPPPWSSTEPGWPAMRRQLSRLRRRAMSRPIRVSLVTLLAVGAVVGRQTLRRETFDASVTFRVAEQSGTPGEGEYMTKSGLREYVEAGVLTKSRCLELIRRLKLFPKELAADPDLALLDFRDALEVKVFMNYFLKQDWEDTGHARSARVRLQFTYTDPTTALKTARAVGDLIREHEAQMRKELSRVAAKQALLLSQTLQQRIERMDNERAGKQLELAQAAGQQFLQLELLNKQVKQLRAALKEDRMDARVSRQLKEAQTKQSALRKKLGPHTGTLYTARLRVDLEQLDAQIEKLQQSLARADSHQTANALRAGLERKQLLMRFEPVDWGRDPTPQLKRSWRLAILGAVMFFILWPVIGVGVGAFDSRVHDLDDVRHLRLKPLGQVPSFPGDDFGCAADRIRKGKHRSESG